MSSLTSQQQKSTNLPYTTLFRSEPTKNRPKKDKEISINNVLLEQKKTKDEQIKRLVEAQKQTQNLLDQQQRLALQDKKLRSEEHTSELQSRFDLVCRLLHEKNKT